MRTRMLAVAGVITVVAAVTSIPVGADRTTGSSADQTHLPVGGAPSSTPAVGKVYACQTTFGGGGAMTAGTWFNGDGTFDLTKKPVVDGDVSWPDARLKVTRQGSKRIITGNDLPLKHTTGTFPVGNTDDAFQFDPNPNSIRGQTITVTLPASPKVAAQPSCTSGGAIGIMLSGVQIFNALDAGGRDAVAYEVPDHCNGHPQQQGAYHYHNLSNASPRPTRARATRSCSGTSTTASGCTGPGARKARSSPTPTSTSATGTRTRSSGTARR